MNAQSLFLDLSARGIVLEIADEKLIFDAPRGVLTENDLAQLRKNKPELIELLSTPPSDVAPDTATPDTATPSDVQRIRALAAKVTPAQFIAARKTIAPALRRNCTGEEINELILQVCLLAKSEVK